MALEFKLYDDPCAEHEAHADEQRKCIEAIFDILKDKSGPDWTVVMLQLARNWLRNFFNFDDEGLDLGERIACWHELLEDWSERVIGKLEEAELKELESLEIEVENDE